MNFAIVAICRS